MITAEPKVAGGFDLPDTKRLAIGGNKPPLNELLTEIHKGLLSDFNRWFGSAERAPSTIDDDETTANIGRIVVELRKIASRAQTAHKEEKAPYLENGRVVDAFFLAGIVQKIAETNAKLEKRQTVYAKAKETKAKEEARIAAEKAQAEADALMAQARHAEDHGEIEAASELLSKAAVEEDTATRAAEIVTAKPQDVAKVRGNGITVSSKVVWVGTIENLDAMDLNELKSVIGRDDIERYTKAFVRLGGRTLKGVKIEEDRKANNR